MQEKAEINYYLEDDQNNVNNPKLSKGFDQIHYLKENMAMETPGEETAERNPESVFWSW